jgi:CubicO group peptidase (beta-lactamase class C family)
MNRGFHTRAIQFLSLLGLLILILAGCSSLPATTVSSTLPSLSPASGEYWPTKAWRTSSPEEQGMDSQMLDQMLTTIREDHLKFHSLLVIRKGYIVSESYFGSYQQDTRHELYSCTKSFVSTLVGIAIDKGSIGGIDHQVLGFFPERTFANPGALKEDMTLEDLLTMRSGLEWEEGNPAYRTLYTSPDWVKFMLDKPMIQPPGSQFNYCSGCSHILSAILQETSGMNPRDFAERVLFKPLGISNAIWDVDSNGIPIGGWGLQLTPREMAKLGYLYLQDGAWDGTQIVSRRWVADATRTHTKTDSELGYGYQWWTIPSMDAYAALGLYGQTILVVPSADLIVVTTAEMADHEVIVQLIENNIIPAVGKIE